MRVAILVLCTIVVAAVFAAMFLAAWNHRGLSEEGFRFHRTTVAELVWGAIPCVMLIACAVPAARLIIKHRAARLDHEERHAQEQPSGWTGIDRSHRQAAYQRISEKR